MFRVRAYRTAAHNLRGLQRPVHDIVEAEDPAGLLELPGVGYSLARSLEKLCRTGRLPLLQRLLGESGPEHQFMSLPGIGLEFATRIHEQLGVESLGELEAASYDGRLAQVPGLVSQFGPLKRKRIIRGREGECAAFYGKPKRQETSAELPI